jgi:signal transduction histidine kinase
LGGIELFSGILRDDLSGDPEKLEHVERIERELAYLKRVVNEFLDYARRSSLTLSPVDVAALMNEIAELLSKDAEEAGVTLSCDAEGTAWARCDADQLRRALINLVRNAIQASSAGATVRLHSATSNADVKLVIEDSGPGIDPELAEKVFRPFFTTRERGTGLGLAFAKKITDEHGGELALESDPGRGARFTVTLPGDRTDGHHTDH